jgi:hypothetical protein
VARDPPRALGIQRHDAIAPTAPVLPRPRQLVGEAHRLVLRRHIDRLAASGLRGPTLDRELLDVLAFGARLMRLLLAQHAVGLEVCKVSPQAPVRERPNRRVGAEVAEQTLEHVLVAGDRRSLQAPLAVALREPAFDRLLKRMLRRAIHLGGGSQIVNDRLEARLRLLRRQVLGTRLGAVSGPPDHSAPCRAPAGVADVGGAEAPAALSVVAVAPERPEGTCATVLVDLALQMARGPFRLAHGCIDIQRLGAANELRRAAGISPGFL